MVATLSASCPRYTHQRVVLPKAHRQEFDHPPVFSHAQRQVCFEPDEPTRQLLAQLGSPLSQAGFLLQLDYFRATTRFFTPATFRRKDWAFVTSRLRLTSIRVRFDNYAPSTARYHRQLILDWLGVAPFQGQVAQQCQQEADQLVAKGLRLPAVFGSLCDYLRTNRQEILAYSLLASIINRAIRHFDGYFQQTLAQHLQPHQQRVTAFDKGRMLYFYALLLCLI